MSALAEFLLARIDEDEADAREELPMPFVDSDFCLTWRPARVLAECEAKRRIVEQYEFHRDQVVAYRNPRWKDAMNEDDKQRWRQAEARHRVAEDFARLLALPYADHPDYRDEWRP